MTIHLMDTTTEDDSFVAVTEHIANILNEGQAKTALAETPGSRFLAECTSLLEEQRFDQYLSKMLGQLDVMFSKSDAKDAECVANVLVHTISRVPADRLQAAVTAFAQNLTSRADERAEERLGALLNLYGALQAHPTLQRQVLLVAVDFARRGAKLAGMLVPSVRGRSGEWIAQWGLDEAQSRELLIALATLVKIGSDRASVKEYSRLVTAALELCKPGDAAAIAQLRPLALAAVADFVRSPLIFQADFAQSPAVTALAADAATKPLYDLFAAMLSGDLASYRAAATPAALEAAGTTAEVGLTKARLLALLALCSSSGHEEVSFKTIQAALDVPADNVESWVVRAIGARLLEAKIDQVREAVIVSRSTQRTFGSSEWKTLQAQLHSWTDGLKQVQQTIALHMANQPAAAPGAARHTVRA